jgi:hypothetical protein
MKLFAGSAALALFFDGKAFYAAVALTHLADTAGSISFFSDYY